MDGDGGIGNDATTGPDAQAASPVPTPELSAQDERPASGASAYYTVPDFSQPLDEPIVIEPLTTDTGIPMETFRRRQDGA